MSVGYLISTGTANSNHSYYWQFKKHNVLSVCQPESYQHCCEGHKRINSSIYSFIFSSDMILVRSKMDLEPIPFSIAKPLTSMFFGGERKPETVEETHRDIGRTCTETQVINRINLVREAIEASVYPLLPAQGVQLASVWRSLHIQDQANKQKCKKIVNTTQGSINFLH